MEAEKQNNISEYMTPIEFRKHLNVDAKTLWRAEKTGKIKPTIVGSVKKFHVKNCKRDWVSNTQRITGQNSSLMKSMENDVNYKPEIKEPTKPEAYPDIPDYGDSKRKTEHFVAKTKELEFKKRSGELVSKKEVEKKFFEFSRKLRDDILSLPGRLAPDLSAESDPQKIELFLTGELNKFLEAIANA